MNWPEVINPIITGLFTLGLTWYREKIIKKNAPGLKETAARVTKVENILAEIQTHTGALRIKEWVVSNGDTTLTGHSMQKLSIFTEYNAPDVDAVAPSYQLVPATNFSRNLTRLADNEEGYIISYEWKEKDELAVLNNASGIKTLVWIKIRNISGKWVGILSVGFEEEDRSFSSEDIAFMKLKASQIGAITK